MNELIKSLVRHALSGVGYILVYKGITTPEVADAAMNANTDLLVGVITFLIGQGLSWKRILAVINKLG